MGIVEKLRKAGVSVWIDQAGIDVSSMWSQEIVSAIKSCKVMLLAISPQSTGSENVVKELSLGSERKKPIIPVHLEPAEIPETMEYQLAGIQRVEYYDNLEDDAFYATLRALSKRGVQVAEGAFDNEVSSKLEISIRQEGNDAERAQKIRRKNKLVPILLLVIVALVCALLFRSSFDDESSSKNKIQPSLKVTPQAKKAKSRLAIIPFKNIGPASPNSFLAEGMHEEINAMLSMAPNLTVKDGSRFKSQFNNVKNIGESLGVESVLTGSVIQSKGKLRVIVKLIDADTEANLWAKTFDKNEGDFFAIQREIAEKVAQGLSLTLNSEYKTLINKRQTENFDAYNLYLEGRVLWNSRKKSAMYQAIEKYELALAKDPEFALGQVGIAECYNMIAGYGFSPPAIAYPKAKSALDKALLMNSNISELHSSLGWYYWNYKNDFENAEKSLLKALSINPSSPEANRWFAQVRAIRFKPQSISEIELAVKLEPTSAITKFVQVRILTSFGKLSDAMTAAKKVVEIDNDYLMAPYGKIEILCLQKKYDEALIFVEEAIAATDDALYYGIKGYILGRLNRKNEAISLLKDLQEMASKRNVRPQYLFMIHYSVGDHEKALEGLRESVNSKTLNIFLFDPRTHWEDLKNSESFQEVFLDIGLPLGPSI